MDAKDKIVQLLDSCEAHIERQLTADGTYYSTREVIARQALLAISGHLAVIQHLLADEPTPIAPANLNKIMAIKVVRDVILRGKMFYDDNETIMPAGQPQPSRHYLGLADCKAVVEALIAADFIKE